jgi:hypothetical protein
MVTEGPARHTIQRMVRDPPGSYEPSNPLRERALAAPLPRARARPPATPACTVTAAASAVSGTDGSDCANAGMRAKVVLTMTKTVRLYATEASTGRPRASTAIIAKAARSASPTKIGLKAPAVLPFLRAISWATAMGEVGDFARISRMVTGWRCPPQRAGRPVGGRAGGIATAVALRGDLSPASGLRQAGWRSPRLGSILAPPHRDPGRGAENRAFVQPMLTASVTRRTA